MDDKGIIALSMMAKHVSKTQDCVLELAICENGVLAHLIPLDAFMDMADYDDEEDE